MLPPFSVVIPAYNEAGRVGQTLVRVLDYLRQESPASELIVVDDGSADATSEVSREALARVGEIESRVIRCSPNHGKGYAVRTGLEAARRPVALFSDADLSTPIEEAPKLLEPIFTGEL